MSFQQAKAASRTLAELLPQQSATVTSVEAQASMGVRLREMGLVPGTRVTMLRRAPLGDPILFELRGYQLSLRKADAKQVSVGAES